jgi:hypothetical protein
MMNMVMDRKLVVLTEKGGYRSGLWTGPGGKGWRLGRVWELGRARAWLLVLGAAMVVSLLSGCASTSVGGSSDQFEYNSITGYPAVGDRPWHL